MPSTCFTHHVFIIRKTICVCSFLWYVFHSEITIQAFYCNFSMKNIPLKKLHVQIVFLLINTWCLEHVEDTKN